MWCYWKNFRNVFKCIIVFKSRWLCSNCCLNLMKPGSNSVTYATWNIHKTFTVANSRLHKKIKIFHITKGPSTKKWVTFGEIGHSKLGKQISWMNLIPKLLKFLPKILEAGGKCGKRDRNRSRYLIPSLGARCQFSGSFLCFVRLTDLLTTEPGYLQLWFLATPVE